MFPRGHITLFALVAAALVLLLAPGRALAQENRDDVYVRVNGTVDLAAGEGDDRWFHPPRWPKWPARCARLS